MATFLPDLKLAFKSLLRAPGFTLTVVLTLALGIGANAAMFSLIDQVLWKPLPFADPSRLMAVEAAEPGLPWSSNVFSAPGLADVRAQTSSFTGLASFGGGGFNLSGGGQPEVVPAGLVSANFFDVIGVQPALGRAFTEAETQEGPASRVAILTHGLWEARYASDPAIVGRTIRLDGHAYEVVGVLPPRFQFAYHMGRAKLFVPMVLSKEDLAERGSKFLSVVGRLKPGVSIQAADQDLKRVMADLAKAYPDTSQGMTASARPLRDAIAGPRRGPLMMLLCVAGLVLLIACVNVAGLQLARGLGRQQELAVRNSLGAPRGSLVRMLMAESLVLAALGGLAGLLVSVWVARGFVLLARLPGDIQTLPGLSTFLFTGALALLTSLVFGLLPAWQASRGDLSPFLREGVRGGVSRNTHRLRSALVVAEIAMAAALLVGAGLTLRTLWKHQNAQLGFRPEGLLTGDLNLPPDAYDDGAKDDSSRENALVKGLARSLVERLQASPGVASAAITNTLPMGGNLSSSDYQVEGEPDLGRDQIQQTDRHQVTPGYFGTLGIRLLAGRDFRWEDADACIVNDTLVRAHFPDGQALGKRIHINNAWHRIVGVVQRTDQGAPGEAPQPQVYLPFAHHTQFQVVVRAKGDPESLRATLAAAPVALDPDLPMSRISTVTSLIQDELRDTRAQGLMFGAFALVALLLAAVGIYGLMSFVARQRTREIGIRMALGATVRDVIGLIAAQGARLALAGVSAGLAAAAALARLLQSQFGELAAADLPVYLAVAATLGLVALAACLLPALQAAKVDPMIALRSE